MLLDTATKLPEIKEGEQEGDATPGNKGDGNVEPESPLKAATDDDEAAEKKENLKDTMNIREGEEENDGELDRASPDPSP